MDLTIANKCESHPSRSSVTYTIESNRHSDKYITLFEGYRTTDISSFSANQLSLFVAEEYLEASQVLAIALDDLDSINRLVMDLDRLHVIPHSAHP